MEPSGEGQIGDGEKPKPVRIDRQLVGFVQLIIDGPTGKDGVLAQASRVNDLDEAIERVERTIRGVEVEIAERKKGMFGELVGPVKAFIDGKLAELNRARKGLETLQGERQEKSVKVLAGIEMIEERIDDYASQQKEYQAAETLSEILSDLLRMMPLYRNIVKSRARIEQSGTDKEKAVQTDMKEHYANKIENLLKKYWEQVEAHRRWIGTMPIEFGAIEAESAVNAFIEKIEGTAAALVEAKKQYKEDLKRSLGSMLQRSLRLDIYDTYLTDEQKQYFIERARVTAPDEEKSSDPDDDTEISKDNS